MFLFSVICLVTLWSRVSSAAKFSIQLDPTLESRMVNGLMHLEVDVDDFLDIICPHKSAYHSNKDNQHFYMELFNVTEEEFNHCSASDKSKILKCMKPRTETKLTIKFQKRSPSPMGFVFRPGQKYYYYSKPTMKLRGGCGRDNLKLVITIREEGSGHHRRKDHRMQSDRHTPKRPNPFVHSSADAMKNGRHTGRGLNNHKSSPVVRPVLKSPQASLASAASSDNDGNAASSINSSWMGLAASSLLTALLFRLLGA